MYSGQVCGFIRVFKQLSNLGRSLKSTAKNNQPLRILQFNWALLEQFYFCFIGICDLWLYKKFVSNLKLAQEVEHRCKR